MVIKLKMIILLIALSCVVGCSVAETRSQNRAVEAENRRLYEIYQKYTESMNEQREMSGIPPKPMRSYEEWRKAPAMD
jgi:hypothetical protein